MTFRQLRDELLRFSEEKLELDVTIYSEAFNEYFPVNSLMTAVGDDRVDDNHPFLEVQDGGGN